MKSFTAILKDNIPGLRKKNKSLLRQNTPRFTPVALEKMPNFPIRKTYNTHKKLYEIEQAELKKRQTYLYFSRVGKWSVFQDFIRNFPTINDQRILDIPSRPLVPFLRCLLVKCINEDTVSKYYWLPHPTLINVELLWEKIITYLLSPKHRDGKEKLKKFRSIGITEDFESANRLFEYFCNAILNQDNIMSYEITDKGISVTFLDCVVSKYKKFIYIKHVWSTRFYTEKENAGMVDGLANLTTAFVSEWNELNKEEQAWLRWKNHQKDPKSVPFTKEDLVYHEKFIIVKAIKNATDLFDGPEVSKGREKGRQNELRRKFNLFKKMNSPFAGLEPSNQQIFQTIRTPYVQDDIPSSSENPSFARNWLIENQFIALQNRDNLSVLQPAAPFDWEKQIALTAGPSECVYLEAHLLSPQDELTTFLGNPLFLKETPLMV